MLLCNVRIKKVIKAWLSICGGKCLVSVEKMNDISDYAERFKVATAKVS